MEETKKKRGRPYKEVRKDERINLRMSMDELEHINNLSVMADKNISDLIRDALHLYEYTMNLHNKKGDN